MYYLDDSEWDINPEDEPTRLWVVPTIAGILIAFAFAWHAEERYITPPKVHVPVQTVVVCNNGVCQWGWVPCFTGVE